MTARPTRIARVPHTAADMAGPRLDGTRAVVINVDEITIEDLIAGMEARLGHLIALRREAASESLYGRVREIERCIDVLRRAAHENAVRAEALAMEETP